jgi:hypothetical protein
MTQLAEPAALVVPLQDCALVPVPSVKTTVCAARGVPAEGTSVVRIPERVAGSPIPAEVAPV